MLWIVTVETVFLRRSIFQLNDGGALNMRKSRLLIIENTYFAGNVAINGGAIRSESSRLTRIINCTFFGNRGRRKGGSMFVSTDEGIGKNVDMIDCFFRSSAKK